jgi:peptide deformylase
VKLKLWQAGEALLRQKAKPLTPGEIVSPQIQDLIGSMRETMHDAPGVGLAAPQVGVSIQLLVIEDPPELIQKLSPQQALERERKPVAFHVVINPKLFIESNETVEFFEGCLSVVLFAAIVPRAKRVRVECLNERAESVSISAEGWYARIVQHEIDHLNGVLYLDRMKSRSFSTQENYLRYWGAKPISQAWEEIGTNPPE